MTQARDQIAKRLLIAPYPFNSRIGSSLVRDLDDEVESMYPDWESLPHPRYVPEFRLVSDGYLVPAIKQDEDSHPPSSSPQHALDALDADLDLKADENTPLQPPATTQKASHGLTPEQIKKLYFFVAFDITDTNADTAKYTSISPFSDPSPFPPLGTPIGCIGLRLLPHFPHHRAPDTPASDPPPPTIAEVKRMYVARSHRGAQHAVFSTPHSNDGAAVQTTVSEMLIDAVARFAGEELLLKKLVLETGVRQRAAVRLYERLGWKQCPVFGDYVGASEEDGGISRCYELVL